MTVATTASPFSRPSSFSHRAEAARTWSPSMMLPSASANSARSASPSNATPASARCSTTARATVCGCVAPHPALIRSPSGSSWIAITPRPAGATPPDPPGRGSVCAVDDYPEPGQRPGRGGDELDVALHRLIVAAVRPGGRGRARRLAHPGLDPVLERVGKLVALTGEELDAVVLGRVVRGRDHRPGVRAVRDHQMRDGRGGEHPEPHDVAAGGQDARGEGVGEPRPGGTRVAPDGHPGTRRAPVVEGPDERPAQGGGEVVVQVSAHDPADAVGPEEARHDRVS